MFLPFLYSAMTHTLFEDHYFLAVNKPAGLLTIPGRGSAGKEETLKRSLEVETGTRLFTVHRLDRDASGAVIFAKNKEGHAWLCGKFENREMEKTYLAVVYGELNVSPIWETIEAPVKAYGSGRMGTGEGGKPSITQYRALEAFKGFSLLEVRPITGRRHQIRVHLYSIGHPILGDRLYYLRENMKPLSGRNLFQKTSVATQPNMAKMAGRLMLHAYKIRFENQEGKKIEITAPMPEDFMEIIDDLSA